MLRNVRDSPARGLSEVLLLGGKEERDGKRERERERERERWREIKAKRERESQGTDLQSRSPLWEF